MTLSHRCGSVGEIAVVDSDASAGLSAIILIPTDRLATRKNSKVLASGPGTIENVQWTPDGKTLVDTTHGGDIDRWSPDGSQVALGESAKASEQRAVIVKADGSDRRTVDAPASEPSDEMELA